MSAYTELLLSVLNLMPEMLVEAREQQALSQQELADRLSVKRQQIQRYESGGYQGASLRRLAEIAQAIAQSSQQSDG